MQNDVALGCEERREFCQHRPDVKLFAFVVSAFFSGLSGALLVFYFGTASVGTVIEWYDFYIFGSLATILSVKFFEKSHPVAALLSTIALFTIGFLVRPLGAFVFGWRTVVGYARRLLRLDPPHYVGHNPLGAWMILALLGTVLATCLTGVLFTTDRFWGVEWVEELHEGLATTVLVLAALHVAGVVVTSLRHREDLVGAMIHGAKRAPSGDDIA